MADQYQFTGYGYMSEWTPSIKRCNQPQPETERYFDWESVKDSIEQATIYAKDWHDSDKFKNGYIVRVTATVEIVASIDQPEELVEEEPFALKG